MFFCGSLSTVSEVLICCFGANIFYLMHKEIMDVEDNDDNENSCSDERGQQRR
jgi:hypothetical protein